MSERCPTCGSAVTVVSSDSERVSTCHYEPVERTCPYEPAAEAELKRLRRRVVRLCEVLDLYVPRWDQPAWKYRELRKALKALESEQWVSWSVRHWDGRMVTVALTLATKYPDDFGMAYYRKANYSFLKVGTKILQT
jgi:hypothetical protein